MTSLREAIREHAIRNRLQYGEASEKAVIGKVLAEFPDERKNIKKLMADIKSVVGEVNNLPDTELKTEKIKRERQKEIKELELPENPKSVVMRFAPNPNGPATLGSARGIIINSELVKRYGGKFIIRFDDTDPKTKRPMQEAYGWYLEDCKWLSARPDEVYYASERIPLYYGYAKELIKLGKAYVCFCSQSEFKSLKDKGAECPHRNQSTDRNMKLWNEMLSGTYKDGECVLRIKTDIEHKDPAIRDWVAFRIVREEHPRVRRKFIVWPMLDFESAIEDHELGITHIIRGKDLIDSEHRQKFIYRYFGWEYPKTLHWGRISVEEFGKFSTSKLRKAIENGHYSGWDDPRIPTLMALKRRGITPEAIRNVMINLSINENDISISLENLFAENRKILDPITDRYFFVQNPVKLIVNGAPEVNVKIPLHPSFRNRGHREFHVEKNEESRVELFISRDDVNRLDKGKEIRLMNLFNVRLKRIGRKIIAEYQRKKNLNVKKIQWVQKYVQGQVIMPEGVVRGYCEESCKNLKIGDVVQFERFGFSRLDRKEDNRKLIFYFAHR